MVVIMMVVMAAARAMHMRRVAMLASAVIVMMVVRMIMAVVTGPMFMVVVVMMMTMTVVRGRCDIGAAFGVERRFDFNHARPEAPRHIFDHVIATNAQALLQKLGRQMTIAEMPGDAHQRGGVRAPNLRKAFGRGDNFDDASVVKRQPVARTQHDRLRQVEKEGEAAHAGHGDAAPVAIVIVEDDRVSGFAGPGAGGTNGVSVLHGLAKSEAAARGLRGQPFPYAPSGG
jgi:hypothetical protein